MKERIKKAWRWLRKHVINKEMLLWFVIAEIIFWLPCIVTGFLAIFVNSWWWTAFGAVIAFWAAPFTPAMPLQFALAVGLKKLYHKIKNRKCKMELKKIYYASNYFLTNNYHIETEYIKQETAKTFIVCKNPDGSGWTNRIRKSDMLICDRRYALSHAEAVKALEEMAKKRLSNNNGRITYLQKENEKICAVLEDISKGKYTEENFEE